MTDLAKQYNRSPLFFVFIMMAVVPLSGLAVDIYLPSLPAVGHYFGVKRALVQLSISVYIYGAAFTQLLAGPISDRFGRRHPFLISTALFILVTVAIPMSGSIYQLLALRFAQGVAAALAIVPMRSVIADVFEGHERDKVVNYMTLAWAMGPIVAPMIGGYLQHYFGWESNFYFLAIYGAFIFTLGLFLPETSQHRHPLHLPDVFRRYASILSNGEFLIGLGMNGLMYSMIILFSVVGPYLIQVDLGYSAIDFGRIALVLGIGWFLGSLTGRFLMGIPLIIKERIAYTCMLVMALTMLVLALCLPLNAYYVVVPAFMMLWLGGTVFPSNFAKVFSLFPKVAGSANALFAGLIFFISASVAAGATYLKSANAVPLACGYIALIAACLILHFLRSLHATRAA